MNNIVTRKIAKLLHNYLQKKIAKRNPDFKVGQRYLSRWWIIPRNPFFNIYYHNFKASDDDRALHCHMYINCSFLLNGRYIEHQENGNYDRSEGALIMRLPKTLHRIQLRPNETCWTLFITGPRVRAWGFQVGPVVRNIFGWKTKSGWMHHEEFVEKYGNKLDH
jgi:hypothetical protein